MYPYSPQARRQAEAMKPGLQHKFGNSTLFSPQTYSDDIKWAGSLHFLKTTCPLSNDSDQPAQMRRLISHCFALISQTSKLFLDERWAHMEFCRKCCAAAEISVILLATSGLHLYKISGYAPGPITDFARITE